MVSLKEQGYIAQGFSEFNFKIWKLLYVCYSEEATRISLWDKENISNMLIETIKTKATEESLV